MGLLKILQKRASEQAKKRVFKHLMDFSRGEIFKLAECSGCRERNCMEVPYTVFETIQRLRWEYRDVFGESSSHALFRGTFRDAAAYLIELIPGRKEDIIRLMGGGEKALYTSFKFSPREVEEIKDAADVVVKAAMEAFRNGKGRKEDHFVVPEVRKERMKDFSPIFNLKKKYCCDRTTGREIFNPYSHRNPSSLIAKGRDMMEEGEVFCSRYLLFDIMSIFQRFQAEEGFEMNVADAEEILKLARGIALSMRRHYIVPDDIRVASLILREKFPPERVDWILRTTPPPGLMLIVFHDKDKESISPPPREEKDK